MPTVLQTAPFGHSGNLPRCLIAPATGTHDTNPTPAQAEPTSYAEAAIGQNDRLKQSQERKE
jgi:hypothetical protein